MRSSQTSPVYKRQAELTGGRLQVSLENVLVIHRNPSFTLWKTRSSSPDDLTALYFRIALPARTSTVRFFSASRRVITCSSTPIVRRAGIRLRNGPIAATITLLDSD